MRQTILVTGSSGKLGRAIVAELIRQGHVVRGFDRVTHPGLPTTQIGSLGDRASLDRAMAGVDCLIHLAATPDDADFLTELLPNNLVGLYHVLEAARAAGVRRLILASSGQVNWWQQMAGDLPVFEHQPVSPKSWYAATKMFLEAIGRSFSEMHGMSVIAVRIGWCPRPDQEEEFRNTPSAHDVYLSPGDAGCFFNRCVEAPSDVRFLIVNATSRPVRETRLDLTVARQVLGFEPRDQWPEGI
jgi:uronate dehydrogenase